MEWAFIIVLFLISMGYSAYKIYQMTMERRERKEQKRKAEQEEQRKENAQQLKQKYSSEIKHLTSLQPVLVFANIDSYTFMKLKQDSVSEGEKQTKVYFENGVFSYLDSYGGYHVGTPQFRLQSADSDSYDISNYNAPKLHFGAATVGGVTTGGVYKTGDTVDTVQIKLKDTGKVHLICDDAFEVEIIRVNNDVARIIENSIGGTPFSLNKYNRLIIAHLSAALNSEMNAASYIHNSGKSGVYGYTSTMVHAKLAKLMTIEEGNSVLNWIAEAFNAIEERINIG